MVQAALIHYQFETIHPFLDGNGRIGRLLILLYLMQQKLLSKPVIHVSCFLKRNQCDKGRGRHKCRDDYCRVGNGKEKRRKAQ